MIRTPEDLRAARSRLGLSAAGLATALRLGANGGRTVRRWESGQIAFSGPVAVAIEAMLQQSHCRCAGVFSKNQIQSNSRILTK